MSTFSELFALTNILYPNANKLFVKANNLFIVKFLPVFNKRNYRIILAVPIGEIREKSKLNAIRKKDHRNIKCSFGRCTIYSRRSFTIEGFII
jgi:hypothetical protein